MSDKKRSPEGNDPNVDQESNNGGVSHRAVKSWADLLPNLDISRLKKRLKEGGIKGEPFFSEADVRNTCADLLQFSEKKELEKGKARMIVQRVLQYLGLIKADGTLHSPAVMVESLTRFDQMLQGEIDFSLSEMFGELEIMLMDWGMPEEEVSDLFEKLGARKVDEIH